MSWHVSVENIAGIRRAEADVEPGVNAVRASNWQGKSSFLAAVETAFGTATPLTEGQSRGRVTLTTSEEKLTVELQRQGASVTRTGTPYLSEEYDRVCADLFAFLDEDNEVRRAVRNGADLEPILTRPLDFEDIDGQIADLRGERQQVERELDQAEDAAERLPRLQQQVDSLERELADLRDERAALETDAEAEDSARERLSELRTERAEIADRIERLEGTTERIRETLSEKRAELDSLSVPEDADVQSELESLQSDLREVERDEELLQSVYEANKRVLDEGRVQLLTEVSHDVLSDSVSCWVCGADATRSDIEAQLAAIDDRLGDLASRATELRERAENLEDRREEIRTARRREQDLTDRIADLETRLSETEESLATARERRSDLDDQIDDLAETVDTTADRVTDLESEIKYTQAELEDRREDLDEAKRRADQRSALEAEYDALTEEIADLRNRKEQVKRRTREAFSSALSDLLGRFDTGFETARLTSSFDLVVARDGREADITALSEGERELLGFVTALAGHEAFDVDERVPVLLLDGLGGFASDNLGVFVEYLTDRATYLIMTAYPEHDHFEGHELSPAEWAVVSRRQGEASS